MRLLLAWALLGAVATADAADISDAARIRAHIDALYPEVERLYIELHQNPELSLQEKRTAATLAHRLRGLGFDVTTGIGGHGIVGLLRNGAGPILMIRTDMDALPIEELTGLPYASRVRASDESGTDVPVMHACGHDIHMAAWIGTAAILSRQRDLWSGTLMLVGQPAEERFLGAKAMLADALFTRFPKPDMALAIHADTGMPAGSVGIAPGYVLANSESVNITIYGRGGHGAYPHRTVDPVVIAARTVLSLQTIVARENDPMEPAVITVGSIHGGTKHNIIPDEVRLQLTVRSYKSEVHKRLLAAIERIAKAEANAALAPKDPVVKSVESTRATFNDAALTARVTNALLAGFGAENVTRPSPRPAGEDFSEYVAAGVRGAFIWVGAADPVKYAESQAGGPALASGHTSFFAPDRERTLRNAILAETLAALELME